MDILDYKYFVFLDVTVNYDGSVGCRNFSAKTNFIRGRLAVPDIKRSLDTPWSTFAAYTEDTTVSPTDTIFISPESKISRDLIRNSGYKITIKEENADKVIVPVMYPTETIESNIVIRAGEVIAFIDVRRRSDYITDPFTEEEWESVLDVAKQSVFNYKQAQNDPNPYIGFNEDYEVFPVYFIRKVEQYKRILTSPQLDRYITDAGFPVTASSNFSIDFLEMLLRYEDENIFNKLLISSDFIKYPLTTNMLLKKRGWSNMTVTEALRKTVLRPIDFDTYYWGRKEDWGENRVISPEDWNLCQKFLMAQFNVPEEGGFVPGKEWGVIRDDFKKFVRTKVAIKPLYITEPTPYPLLMSLVGNK